MGETTPLLLQSMELGTAEKVLLATSPVLAADYLVNI